MCLCVPMHADNPKSTVLLSAAIAMHGPSDVRPVLDSYKAEGDENVLRIFKAKQVHTMQ